MADDLDSVTGFVVDSGSDGEQPSALHNAALGKLWDDVKHGASPPKRARIGIPQGDTSFEVDELRKRDERVLPETGEWRETGNTDEGGRFETDWRNEEAERIAILEKNPDYQFMELVSGHAGRPAHRLYDDSDVDRAMRERRVQSEQRIAEQAALQRAAVLREREKAARKEAERIGLNIANTESYLNTSAIFRLARQHRQAAEAYAEAKTTWLAQQRVGRAEVALLDVLLQHASTGITNDDIDASLLLDVAPSILSHVQAQVALPPGAVAAAVGGDRARTAAMFTEAMEGGGSRVDAAKAAARFVTLRTLWQMGQAADETGSELSLAIAENRHGGIQRALDQRRREARAMLIGVLSEDELAEGEGELLVRFLDTADNFVTNRDVVVWDGEGMRAPTDAPSSGPHKHSVLNPDLHGVAGAAVAELLGLTEWTAKIAAAFKSVRDEEGRDTTGPLLAEAVRPYVLLGGGAFLDEIGALASLDVPEEEQAVLHDNRPPHEAFYGTKMFEIYSEYRDDLAVIDAAIVAAPTEPDFGGNERAEALFRLMEPKERRGPWSTLAGHKLFLDYEARLVRAHLQLTMEKKLARRLDLVAHAEELGLAAESAELPQARYQHRRAWVELPEHSGIVRLDSVVISAIDDAFRLVQRWAKWGKDVDVEFLQHDPQIRGDFAKLVALRMAPATQIFQTSYKQLGIRDIVDRDVINVMQSIMKGYDVQITGATAPGAPRATAELRSRASRRGEDLIVV